MKTETRGRKPHKAITYRENGEPTVEQGLVHGWEVSYNPDTECFCAHAPIEGSIVATFNLWRNLVYWCKNH